MREAYQVELAGIGQLLVSMAEGVGEAMQRATTALLSADHDAAEAVIAGDVEIDALHDQVEQSAYQLLALQAPVASDLRTLVTALHVAADLERMGDLARHVAKIALMRYPQPATAPELSGVFADMAKVAKRIAVKVTEVLAARDATRAAELEQDDDEMDELHRRLFGILIGDWPHGVEAAVDAALLGRFYERYADHAVNAGEQVVYLVTGTTPQTVQS